MTATNSLMSIDSPIGRLTLEANDHALVALWLPGSLLPYSEGSSTRSAILRSTATQLEEYFARERKEFTLALEMVGTPFQRAVWDGLLEVPYGMTVSYGTLAQRLGRPGSSRAIGQANARNPIPIIVPCHRVVASNGLGGYAGGLAMKEALLELERR
ncbi:MAG: methylated-DNA--[protein]-cysteine S-methyltransferase [Acidimicrobiales bacterium]